MNIIDLLETAKDQYQDQVVYKYKEGGSTTFAELYQNALNVAAKICAISPENQPITVIAHKHLHIPAVYMGIAHANCYYVPISAEMPKSKIESILALTASQVIVTDYTNLEMVQSLNFKGHILLIDQCIPKQKISDIVYQRRSRICDTDPLYVIFTSGSSGTPKGVVTAHRSVCDYVTTFAQTFAIGPDEILGNQAPLDYVAGIRDIYLPIVTGCQSVFIPKNYFSVPKILFAYLNENHVTTICWVSAALSLCCTLNVFAEIKPLYLKKVFFTGSVFDYKHLNTWVHEMPNTTFVNHYGPTEITASCTYYQVDNRVKYTKPLPIGKPFANRKVFVLCEDHAAQINEIGEICVSGTCVALGYFKNPEKTKQAFVQNPLNQIYPETIYKTGDLGFFDKNGILHFVGRSDNQIKHMGHRVELDEIENFVNALEGVNESCCAYNFVKGVITLFYSGPATPSEISKHLRENLPSFMIPRKFIQKDALPKLFNGKIDRQTLKQQLDA